MSNPNPNEIRREIDQTRAELGRDVDALAEKMDPNKVVDRQTEKVRNKWTDLKESVMGSADDHDGPGALQQAGDEASQMADQAPETIKRRTRGNPLAAGMIALGVGWLIGSLIPASRAEQDAASTVKDKAQPAMEEAKSAAQEMGENLKPQAQEAADSLKGSAQDSMDRVKDEGQHRAQDLQEDSQQAAQRVKDTAQDS